MHEATRPGATLGSVFDSAREAYAAAGHPEGWRAHHPGGTIADPVGLLLPGAIYDAILGMFIGPLVVMLHDRRVAPERVDW